MNKILKPKDGVTLIDILVSILLLSTLVIAAAATILNCLFLASYSRHKIQAMFVAQQIMEQQRRQVFSTIPFQTTTSVTLDNNSGGSFLGTAIVTLVNLDIYRNQINVEIDWPEQVLTGKITIKEYYSTNIVNDPIPN